MPQLIPMVVSRLGSIGDHQRVRHGATLSQRNIRRQWPGRSGRTKLEAVAVARRVSLWVVLCGVGPGVAGLAPQWRESIGCTWLPNWRVLEAGPELSSHHKVVVAILLSPSVPLVLSETLQYSEGQCLRSKIMF